MRTRDQIMTEWDAVRAKIASGCTNDGPRLWLEGVLDDYDEAVPARLTDERQDRVTIVANCKSPVTSG